MSRISFNTATQAIEVTLDSVAGITITKYLLNREEAERLRDALNEHYPKPTATPGKTPGAFVSLAEAYETTPQGAIVYDSAGDAIGKYHMWTWCYDSDWSDQFIVVMVTLEEEGGDLTTEAYGLAELADLYVSAQPSAIL